MKGKRANKKRKSDKGKKFSAHKLLTEYSNFYLNELINVFEQKKLVHFYIDGRLSIWRDKDNAVESLINNWRRNFFYRGLLTDREVKLELSTLLTLLAQVIVQQNDDIKARAISLIKEFIIEFNTKIGWNLQKHYLNQFVDKLNAYENIIVYTPSRAEEVQETEEETQIEVLKGSQNAFWKISATILLILFIILLIIATLNLKTTTIPKKGENVSDMTNESRNMVLQRYLPNETRIESLITNKINEERGRKNLTPLIFNRYHYYAAKENSKKLLSTNVLYESDYFKNAVHNIGENLAIIPLEAQVPECKNVTNNDLIVAECVVDLWKSGAGSRIRNISLASHNIIHFNYGTVGIGVACSTIKCTVSAEFS